MSGASVLVQAVRGPILMITLGILVAIDHFWIYSFARTWPILIIVFGFLKLLERVVAKPANLLDQRTGGVLPPPQRGNNL